MLSILYSLSVLIQTYINWMIHYMNFYANIDKKTFRLAIKELITENQIKRNSEKKKPRKIVIFVTQQIQFDIQCYKIGISNEGELKDQGQYQDIKSSLYMTNEELAQKINQQIQQKKESNHVNQKFFENKNLKFCCQQLSLQNNNSRTIRTYLKYQQFSNVRVILFVPLLEAGSAVLINYYQRIVSIFYEHQQENDIDTVQYIQGMLIQNSSQRINQEIINFQILSPASYFDENHLEEFSIIFSNNLSLFDSQKTELAWMYQKQQAISYLLQQKF
ncbi:unnamed protein product [Paramecium pentaurelia]|uniref:Uncharacterized protein n=1 Tax=Paramecium pentaurelia TaxID=43138 RepID=A0A8S1TXT9_9CILI|nr:unnamed protein product [Paramecium pentaurelia]